MTGDVNSCITSRSLVHDMTQQMWHTAWRYSDTVTANSRSVSQGHQENTSTSGEMT